MNSNPKPLTRWKRFRYRLEAAVVGTLARLLPLLPYGIMWRFAHGFGWLGYHLLTKPRRIALANLDVAFGSSKTTVEKERIARISFQNFATSMFTLFWSQRLTRRRLDQIAETNIDRLQCIRELQARGKGLLFLTPHYGNWELFTTAAALYGVPLNIVTETMRNPALDAIFTRLRSRSGHRIIPQRSAAVKLYKALRRAETVGLLIDLNAPEETGGVWLDFFGLPVFNNAAVAALALRTGAAIIGCYCRPLPNGRVQIVLGSEITYTPTEDYEADVRAISQKCLNFCEETIRERPEYWLWSYKRWKHRPTTEQGRYPFYATYLPPKT